MGATDLPTAAHMIDIDNAIRFLLVAFFTGAAGIIGTVVLAAKWYIPRRLRQQTAERQVQLDALKAELETKRTADAVELERERLLPQIVEQNRVMANNTITLAQSFNTTMQQVKEQDVITAAALTASTKQLTANTERLEEVADAVNKVNDAIADIKTVLPTLARKSEMDLLIGRMDDAIHRLEELKRDCLQKKHDSKELPLVTIPAPTDKGTILITGIEPDNLDLRPTGTTG